MPAYFNFQIYPEFAALDGEKSDFNSTDSSQLLRRSRCVIEVISFIIDYFR